MADSNEFILSLADEIRSAAQMDGSGFSSYVASGRAAEDAELPPQDAKTTKPRRSVATGSEGTESELDPHWAGAYAGDLSDEEKERNLAAISQLRPVAAAHELASRIEGLDPDSSRARAIQRALAERAIRKRTA